MAETGEVHCENGTVQSLAQIREKAWIQLAEMHAFSRICIRRAHPNAGNGIFSPFPALDSGQLRKNTFGES